MKKLKKHQFFIVAAIAFVLIGILIYAAVRIYNYYFGMRLMNTGGPGAGYGSRRV